MLSIPILGVGLGAVLGAGAIVLYRRAQVGNFPPVRAEQWTRHFNAREFASRGREMADRDAYRALAGICQRIRGQVGRPVAINDGERKPDHNRDVDGAPDSRHLPAADRSAGARDGVACDLRVPGYSQAETYRLWRWIDEHAADLGIGGTEFYPRHNFIHIDTRHSRARWPDESGRSAWEAREGT